jgi:hypothetical protein
MLTKLLALPFLAVWILAGLVGLLMLALLVHVRSLERDEHVPYRTRHFKAAGWSRAEIRRLKHGKDGE